MAPVGNGYFQVALTAAADYRYFYRLDGERDHPDPASRYQPEGVHGASALVDLDFAWHDQGWHGIPLEQLIIYELHIGTFTPEGTFAAAIEQLSRLQALGVTAVELMPVAQFPGARNWGYDGVYPFAVQHAYGGPLGLQQFVNACHQHGLAVILDVVYNHLGPEGNYFSEYGPYFTNRYHTPWGEAINFDGEHSDQVRRFFIENALYWLDHFHIDALRLDAVHAIYDFSARPFLAELAAAVRLEGRRLNRQVFTIAESDLNDSRLIRPTAAGGLGLDAQWSDDLHHAIHTAVSGERAGYYADFHGFDDVVKAYRDGYVIDGGYSAVRGRRHGNPARDLDPAQFVVCAQNHDQVGNRMLGERLSELVSWEPLKLAAGCVLLSPYQPLIFMGEEYAEPAPFQYFVSHSDPALIEAVRVGRRAEFASFDWHQEPPDPQAADTFQRSKLDLTLPARGRHRVLHDFYAALIGLRRGRAELCVANRDKMEINAIRQQQVFAIRRWSDSGEVVVVFHFGTRPVAVPLPLTAGDWTTLLDSADEQWGGPGTQLLPQFGSAGTVRLQLQPTSLLVVEQRQPFPG